MRRSTEEITLSFDGKYFTQKDKKVTASLPVKKIPLLIPYYFLEAVQYENYNDAIELLDKNNYDKIEPIQLKNFFGSFTDVLQNPYHRELAPFAAIKQKVSDSLYQLKYYNFEIKDGKIENITELK